MPPEARLRIRTRVLVWHDVLPAVRLSLTLMLVVVCLVGIRHWQSHIAAASPLNTGIGGAAAELTPSPTIESSATPIASPATFPSPTPAGGTSPAPSLTATPTPIAEPTVEPLSTLRNNQAPLADAGPNTIVRPGALVILDGTGSFDPDTGDTAILSYNWRQLDGPVVDLLSDRTVQPNFTAGGNGETYIFGVTVRDGNGASAIDTVTISVESLPTAIASPMVVTRDEAAPPTAPLGDSFLVSKILKPTNYLLLILALVATGLLFVERIIRNATERTAGGSSGGGAREQTKQGQVVHHKTGDPIAGALVLIYGADGKLRVRETTNEQGIFPTFFPAGQYSLTVQAAGFTFAPAANKTIAPADALLYSGGSLTVQDTSDPLTIVVPMKPSGADVSPSLIWLLHAWQSVQHFGRAISWPLFVAGALLNTMMVFLAPGLEVLAIEVVYVVLIIIKIALEVRVRPAYGQVRDAITHIPLDLAVVRLFDQKNNRLIMTRVTNTQGKFFALPPARTYRVTIAKPGYATFSKDNVEIQSEHDSMLQMTADLLPIAPQPTGSLATARAATL